MTPAVLHPLRRAARRASPALLLLALGCSGSIVQDVPEEPVGPPPVVLRPGATTQVQEDQAARLYGEASVAADVGFWRAALEAAEEVVARYPSTRVSGPSLLLVARARTGLGQYEAADAAAGGFARLLGPGDARLIDARLLQARAMRAAGDPVATLDRLLLLPTDVEPPVRDTAAAWVDEAAEQLGATELAEALRGAPLDHPLAIPLYLHYASVLRFAGDTARVAEYARAALAAGATGADAAAARALLAGRDPGLTGGPGAAVRLGLVLPTSGSPALRRFAALMEDGVRAAIAADPGLAALELDVRDDRGDAAVAAAILQELEAGGTLAVLGPLQGDAVAAAAAARRSPVPLVSPTALDVPEGAEGVLSLGSPDPGAARALARYAADAGFLDVVVLHSAALESAFEARVFGEAFRELGGRVLRDIEYLPGTTDFRGPIREAIALRPEALVLPLAPGDVQVLAPQVGFYGVDTLAVRILGTAPWTDPDVLRNLDARYSNGVVTATPALPGQEAPGYRRFVQAYESHFRRTLRDPTPALGYDAASLVLEALRSGARTPATVAAALEGIEGFEGATGTLSVEDGRIVREHRIVCIEDRALLDVPHGAAAELVRGPYVVRPDSDEPRPRGPGRIVGKRCPDEASPPFVPDAVADSLRRSRFPAGVFPADSVRPDSVPPIRRDTLPVPPPDTLRRDVLTVPRGARRRP